jgi:hypothetical protein
LSYGEDDDEVDDLEDDEDPTASQLAARTAAVATKTAALATAKSTREPRIKKDEKVLLKIREGAHERKTLQLIEDNISLMWAKMSPASQSSVSEEEGFEEEATRRRRMTCATRGHIMLEVRPRVYRITV